MKKQNKQSFPAAKRRISSSATSPGAKPLHDKRRLSSPERRTSKSDIKDAVMKVEENELSGLEAEEPYETGKVIAKQGTVVRMGKKDYTLTLPLVNDYGLVSMMPRNGTQPVLLHYEWNKSKAKRIQNEAKVLLYCSGHKLKYTYRVIMAGQYDQLKIHYLITKCYGLSLSELQANQPAEKFTKPTCLKLGFVTLKCIEKLHETGFIHRDIKPEVFVTGQAAPHQIYIVHFGLARRFQSKEKGHVLRRPSLPLIGNKKYISRNAHKRRDRSQSDDVESWLYMFIELFDKNLLTWSKKTNQTTTKDSKELFMSENGFIRTTKACPSIPQTFYEIFCHINTLDFTSVPNFEGMKNTIKKEIELNNFKNEPYDWIKNAKGGSTRELCMEDLTSSSEDIKSGERSGREQPKEPL